ncbi:hypothetical protein D3C81_1264000 [compost metagenome]
MSRRPRPAPRHPAQSAPHPPVPGTPASCPSRPAAATRGTASSAHRRHHGIPPIPAWRPGARGLRRHSVRGTHPGPPARAAHPRTTATAPAPDAPDSSTPPASACRSGSAGPAHRWCWASSPGRSFPPSRKGRSRWSNRARTCCRCSSRHARNPPASTAPPSPRCGYRSIQTSAQSAALPHPPTQGSHARCRIRPAASATQRRRAKTATRSCRTE